MRLMPKLVLAAVAGTAALAAAAFAGASTQASSPPCSASDIDCRLTEIEASLARIERALATGGGSASAGAGVPLASSDFCDGSNESGCQTAATRVCEASGFRRGVPTQTAAQPYGGWRLVRVTCVD